MVQGMRSAAMNLARSLRVHRISPNLEVRIEEGERVGVCVWVGI